MHRYQKKHHFFLTFVLIFELFFTSSFPASSAFFGGGPSIPSTSKILSDMEQRYHLDPAALRDEGETMNVSASKGSIPEVSLSFSPSDPKEGQMVTAKAFPTFFANKAENLYYTWVLKHKGEATTLEDWKVEAAKKIVQGGYDPADNGYPNSDTDNDGYQSIFGGNDGTTGKKVNEDKKYCYINNQINGLNYELVTEVSGSTFGGCPSIRPVVACFEEIGVVEPATITANGGDGGNGAGGSGGTSGSSSGNTTTCTTDAGGIETCTTTGGSSTAGTGGSGGSGIGGTGGLATGTSFIYKTSYNFLGFPVCVPGSEGNSSTMQCSAGGTMLCVTNASISEYPTSTPIALLPAPPTYWNCSPANPKNECQHLFPNAPGQKTGDGKFFLEEERFWVSDPQDPSTADNGNKDEANVTGLGQSSFSWIYQAGDEVGVAVEGTSAYGTKHNDSSSMIMWAFSNQRCDIAHATGTDSYVESVKGYPVTIPTVKIDLNKCLKDSLVDPTAGGQPTKITVEVTTSPDSPTNDSSTDKSGDLLTAVASLEGEKDITNILFEWQVYIGEKMADVLNTTKRKDITQALRDNHLLGNTKGNGLNTLNLNLNLTKDQIRGFGLSDSLSEYYLLFRATATESFLGDGQKVRKGRSETVAKFINSSDKISVKRVSVDDTSGKLTLGTDTLCGNNAFEKSLCRVVKNEVIGLQVDNTDNSLQNFRWTINDAPLLCTARVSNYCAEGGSGTVDAESQTNKNFFPVTGNPGDTYNVTVVANNVRTGKLVTLTRSFIVVEPTVILKTTDKNTVFPKFLGQYKDISGASGCPNGFCDEFSESVYEAFPGITGASLYAEFTPTFLSTTPVFTIDGTTVSSQEWSSSLDTPKEKQIVPFTIEKLVGQMYTVGVTAEYVESPALRKALLDIWGISPFDSPEIRLSSSIQLNVVEDPTQYASLTGPRKYYAAVASYIPSSVLFTFRIFLSALLVLFVLHFVNRMLESRRLASFVKDTVENDKE